MPDSTDIYTSYALTAAKDWIDFSEAKLHSAPRYISVHR